MPGIDFAFEEEKDGTKVLVCDAYTKREREQASRLRPFSRGRKRRFPRQRGRFVTEVIKVARPGSSAELLESDPFYSTT